MWRRLYTRKGQSTGEYALIFAIVLGAIVAMQVYIKRELQGRVKDGSDYMTQQTTALGNTSQYEPYYFNSDYTTARTSKVTEGYTGGESTTKVNQDLSIRQGGGYTEHTTPEEQTE